MMRWKNRFLEHVRKPPAWIGVMLVLCLVVSAWGLDEVGLLPARAQSVAYLSLDPASAMLSGCGESVVNIVVNDVEDAYGVDIQVDFDPNLLEVVDQDTGQTGVQMTPLTGFLKPGFVARNVADNTTGTAWYAMTQFDPEPAKSGTGAILAITFRARGTGTSALTLHDGMLADREGMEIAITSFVDGSLTTTPPVAPVLSIAKIAGPVPPVSVQLSWTTSAGAASYSLYRDTIPYFTPGAGNLLNSSTGTTYDDLNILGDTVVQHYYTLRANCANGYQSENTNRVGEYDWPLVRTAASNLNDVSWVFNHPTIDNTIELNADLGGGILRIQKFDSTTQTWRTFAPLYTGNFSLTPGMFLFIVTDTTAQPYYTMVGNVPDPAVQFTLVGGSQPLKTYVSLPLDRAALNTSRLVYLSIGSSVNRIMKFDANTQTYRTFAPEFSGIFSLVIGEPFIILKTGTPIVWP